MTTFFVDGTGSWSGGGQAFLSNARYAAERHSILRGDGPGSVPIIPRNIPARSSRTPGKFVLAPQNAWPWVPSARGLGEYSRLAILRVGSEYYARKAHAILRISSTIPPGGLGVATSPVIHNVLDRGFEDALQQSETESIRDAKGALVSIGSVYSYRNFTRLVDGYLSYRDAGGDLPLFIAGPPSNKKVVRQLDSVAARHPQIRTRWGSMSRSRCLAAMRDAACVVLPSLVEASPFSALEAVAMNPNVLLSQIAGNDEILRPFGHPNGDALFDPRSPSAIADALGRDYSQAFSCHNALKEPQRREHERERWALSIADWLHTLADS